MVNCNPETVSTDYDTSDRLYFEPLTAEDVLEILRVEQSNGELVGVIVQFGGQTPLKLAQRAGRGGHPDPRHHRPTPSTLPKTASASPSWSTSSKLKQPDNGIAYSRDEAAAVAASHRLSGAAAPVLRAGRPGDGDRRLRSAARRLHRHRGATCRATARCWSTSICAMRSNAMSTRCAMASRS